VLRDKDYQARALKAWDWAEANPRVIFRNNDAGQGSEGLAAGQQEVDETRYARKRLIAASYLYGATRNLRFSKLAEQLYGRVKPVQAGTVNGFEGEMAFTMLYLAKQPKLSPRFTRQIRRDYAANVLGGYNGWPVIAAGDDPYGAHVDGYWWGSNAVKARRGSVFTQAALHNIGPQSRQDYTNAASHYLHYLHGVNPNGKTYLTNMGALGAENSVSSLYHAWFVDGSPQFDDVRTSRFGPAPGFLVGGPNDSYARDDCCPNACGAEGNKVCRLPVMAPPSGQPPAKSYADFNAGWPLNSWEVTENSNGYQVDYLRLLSKFAR
jgi:hypothetical protein